jgi:hypothetical protein
MDRVGCNNLHCADWIRSATARVRARAGGRGAGALLAVSAFVFMAGSLGLWPRAPHGFHALRESHIASFKWVAMGGKKL